MKQPHQASYYAALIPLTLQFHLPHLPSFSGLLSSPDIDSSKKSIHRKSSFGIKHVSSPTEVNSPESRRKNSIVREVVDQDTVGYLCGEIEHDQQGVLEDSLTIEMSNLRGEDITWKLADHGYKLLKLAVTESTAPKLTDVPFSRQVYINSLTYLIRALPSNLSTDEKILIQAALPEDFVHSSNQQAHPSRAKTRATSFLHRTLALAIVQLFVLFRIILPYLRFLLIKVWAYEREHRILVKIATKSVELGIDVGEAMKSMGETKTGEALISNLQWVMEGVIGGIVEGITIISASEKKI
ncbi:hypothetical protein Golomagni_03225 [Golovinomyces magnicellulatus]|nr:hypothetical protein Golomagni_03225 [Golovinomyces magnicellulatus]